MANTKPFLTEDDVRNKAGYILGFVDGMGENIVSTDYISGVGQITTFNELGKQCGITDFIGISDKPDGWFLPINPNEPAIILEVKNSKEKIDKEKWINELKKNVNIAKLYYKKVIGILYNGFDLRVEKNEEEVEVVDTLQNKEYYFSIFNKEKIDKQKIYRITKQINDCLHSEFKLKNLYHRMIVTACSLVAERYGADLSGLKNRGYSTLRNAIRDTLSKSLEDSLKQNRKLDLLLEVYSEIKINITENQKAINDFIDWVCEISSLINSDYWNGEDVMAIFFNEFNRYKGKSESGQVFTPDHITSFMYRLIDVHKDDYVLDAACGSGSFLVKAMCMMINEAGGPATKTAKEIKDNHLFGIEFDREIYALACANMLIHKDGKTNIENLDTRLQTACSWIESKPITKVLMNPPFEKKYGCIDIVSNVLNSVAKGTMCAFILPDKKLEMENKQKVKRIIRQHTLQKIIKLPEKTFAEGVTTSIFIFEAKVPQNKKDIFTCYIKDDGLETVKNQGRQDIKNNWAMIEDKWVDIILKQRGDDTIEWIDPSKHLSYQMPKKAFEVSEQDFMCTAMEYILFEQKIDSKAFNENILKSVLYSPSISTDCGITALLSLQELIEANQDSIEEGIEKIKQDVAQTIKSFELCKTSNSSIDTCLWKSFRIKDLFKLSSPRKRFNAKDITIYSEQLKNTYPYVVRTKKDNGQKGYVTADKQYLSPANTFSFGQDTATIFYQTQPYFTGDKIKVMSFKDDNINISMYTALFLTTIINKAFSNFLWGVSSFDESVLLSVDFLLPVDENEKPDYIFMENYMRYIFNTQTEKIDSFNKLFAKTV